MSEPVRKRAGEQYAACSDEETQEKYKRLSEKPPAGGTEKRADLRAECRSCWRQSIGPAGFSGLHDIEYLQTG